MTNRVIAFEIDDEIAGHFDALVKNWDKDPVWLARAFFEEEVKALTSGTRGVPRLRRYMYHDATPYFTAGELEQRSAERERQLADQSRLLYQLVTGTRVGLVELDRLFDGGENDQSRAYALSGALVHDILQRHGSNVGAQILERMRGGMTFDEAFSKVVGVLPATAENQFWDRQRIWTNWVPILGSATTLWIVVTLLALIAIYRRSRLDREIEKRWEEEDGEDEPPTRT